jgi:hypothetical protein
MKFATVLLILLTLVSVVSAAEPDKLELDRKAILSMAGTYDVKFQFQETVALQPGYKKHEPEDDDAKELVLVIRDEPHRIELQHLLMAGDHVVKHWRQEWVYQSRELWQYQGHGKWAKTMLSAEEVAGKWTQRVTNVDDSPRYEGIGRWEHGPNWTAWESGETFRPLPRREYTTRSDYHIIIGRNRHVITPSGWVHEQDNAKVVLNDAGQPTATLTLERGLNTYNKTEDKGFDAARQYWTKHAAYWSAVRTVWIDLLSTRTVLQLRDEIDGKKLFEHLHNTDHLPPADKWPTEVRAVIDRYLQTPAVKVGTRS